MADIQALELRPATVMDQLAIGQLVLQSRLNPLDLNWQRFTVATTHANEIVGCGQIRQHQGFEELASLVVKPNWQGSGLSALLMADLLGRSSRPLWLMCESPLVPFYLRYQFEEIKPTGGLPDYFRFIHWASGGSFSPLTLFRGTYLAFMVLR